MSPLGVVPDGVIMLHPRLNKQECIVYTVYYKKYFGRGGLISAGMGLSTMSVCMHQPNFRHLSVRKMKITVRLKLKGDKKKEKTTSQTD